MSGVYKQILSIEDNPDLLELIKLVLRHAPTEVIPAQDAEAAWQILQTTTPDLILLDMMLPGMSGLDFLAQLRADERFRTVPVIVLSIRSDINFRRRAQELGVYRYLLKPFSPSVLRSEVEQALGVDWKKYWTKPKTDESRG